MNNRSDWYQYDEGYSIGTVGADGGAIVRDEEHKLGARLTLEEEGSSADLTLTCAVYGWLFHTRYFQDEAEAFDNFAAMKEDVEEILELISGEENDEETEDEILGEIAAFVEKYP